LTRVFFLSFLIDFFNFIPQHWVDWELNFTIFFYFAFYKVVTFSLPKSWIYMLTCVDPCWFNMLSSQYFFKKDVISKKKFSRPMFFLFQLSMLLLDLPSWTSHNRSIPTQLKFFILENMLAMYRYFFNVFKKIDLTHNIAQVNDLVNKN